MDKCLEIIGLTKKFKNFSLQDVTFSLARGYIMGFIGPNGAGKSTTIKLIMNLLRKDTGTIKVFGLDHIADEKKVKERIGFVYDENHFYEELTLEEMKRIIAPFYQGWEETTYRQYLKLFGLPAGRKIKDLSKGMKMKYSLALALSHRADLIIMDEPTAGLDPIVRSELLDILYRFIQDENKAVLFSTHLTSDLDKVADYITFINEGQIVFSLPKEDVLTDYAIVKGDTALGAAVREKSIGIRENRFGFEALVRNVAGLRRAYGDKLVYAKPTLEEIMLYTVRRDDHVNPDL